MLAHQRIFLNWVRRVFFWTTFLWERGAVINISKGGNCYYVTGRLLEGTCKTDNYSNQHRQADRKLQAASVFTEESPTRTEKYELIKWNINWTSFLSTKLREREGEREREREGEGERERKREKERERDREKERERGRGREREREREKKEREGEKERDFSKINSCANNQLDSTNYVAISISAN